MVAYDISYVALSRLDTYQCYVIKEKITTVIAYLSGGMENANNNGADWRREITVWLRDNLGHSVVDPVIESNKLITENDAKDFRKWKESDPDRFRNFIRLAIKIDLDGVVNKADYVICLWDESVLKGGGSHGEITLAYYNHKPIFLVNQLPLSDLSGWIMSCATEIVTDFDRLKKILHNKYSNAKNRS